MSASRAMFRQTGSADFTEQESDSVPLPSVVWVKKELMNLNPGCSFRHEKIVLNIVHTYSIYEEDVNSFWCSKLG